MGGIVSAWQFRPRNIFFYNIDINKVDNFTSFINNDYFPWFFESFGNANLIKIGHLLHLLILSNEETFHFTFDLSIIELCCISSGRILLVSDDTNKIKHISLLDNKILNIEKISEISCKSFNLRSNPTYVDKIFNSRSKLKICSNFWHLLVHDGLPNVYLGSRKNTEKGGVFVSFRGVLQQVIRDRWT